MNNFEFKSHANKLQQCIRFYSRHLDFRRMCTAFSKTSSDSIQRVYVINMDRQTFRWERMKNELSRIITEDKEELVSIARRFSAVDARYLNEGVGSSEVSAEYPLSDQLTVEPHPLLEIDGSTRTHDIAMTAQERAVALSHVGVWKNIASGDVQYTLVLEDDVYFPRKFGRRFGVAWEEVKALTSDPDLLYVSYQTVNENALITGRSGGIEKAPVGMWYASGYVLSKAGAEKLLALLPVRGPVDLWLNLQFQYLASFRTKQSLIEQRVDTTSTNSYSIMPVLSKLGVYNYDNPELHPLDPLPQPIFVSGEPGTGLTSLATALSMIGYTCCSDVDQLLASEASALLVGKTDHVFNAYVNVGDLDTERLTTLYPEALFIHTYKGRKDINSSEPRTLALDCDAEDKWQLLSNFLKIEYPAHRYPIVADLGMRPVIQNVENHPVDYQNEWDKSPWCIQDPNWSGIRFKPNAAQSVSKSKSCRTIWQPGQRIEDAWKLRDDTFPSNLALFRPACVEVKPDCVELTLQKQSSNVRSYASGAIASHKKYSSGRFIVELRPAKQKGAITGVFLHRNGPRQEIDIEFMGNDTSSMLINVYFNPGIAGTKLEYGYRGSPTRIPLGFDAGDDFHRYEIDWNANRILWKVDEMIVHRRDLWQPTPIPNLPLEFNINLWCSRSDVLAGTLDSRKLPTSTFLRKIEIIGVSCN